MQFSSYTRYTSIVDDLHITMYLQCQCLPPLHGVVCFIKVNNVIDYQNMSI